jgi:hypothetical protein
MSTQGDAMKARLDAMQQTVAKAVEVMEGGLTAQEAQDIGTKIDNLEAQLKQKLPQTPSA